MAIFLVKLYINKCLGHSLLDLLEIYIYRFVLQSQKASVFIYQFPSHRGDKAMSPVLPFTSPGLY